MNIEDNNTSNLSEDEPTFEDAMASLNLAEADIERFDKLIDMGVTPDGAIKTYMDDEEFTKFESYYCLKLIEKTDQDVKVLEKYADSILKSAEEADKK